MIWTDVEMDIELQELCLLVTTWAFAHGSVVPLISWRVVAISILVYVSLLRVDIGGKLLRRRSTLRHDVSIEQMSPSERYPMVAGRELGLSDDVLDVSRPSFTLETHREPRASSDHQVNSWARCDGTQRERTLEGKGLIRPKRNPVRGKESISGRIAH